ncbi:unnamed protein product [Kuraishia capsulata CBS 1993]|uniref:Eukaryotic translation initiation factor 3 subunit G n=1 Tax=Kuraishia capsulata CBS 1993 TaxID=1382522 RepID=W6MMD3_9ASCO|nr:uncharacterized protein KUCA_T00003723001 [Kuraishia capsulata CBS 1993]CDK27744.1 unnamed protein product [Kuraishia capsulata CBS 1993]
MAEVAKGQSWADVEDDLPSPQVIDNKDGTKTVISYRLNEAGKKIKLTQKVREIKVTEKVNKGVAQRRKWSKFGDEKDSTTIGPDFRTTQVGTAVELVLGTSWRGEESKKEEEKKLDVVKATNVKCRTCDGNHFTSKCPFKDTLGADPEGSGAHDDGGESAGAPGAYIAPHLRAGGSKLGGRNFEERDDSTTLRVTQLNEMVDEDMIREELFAPFGMLRRVTLVRDRETGQSKGTAYVAYETVEAAQKAMENLDGRGYHSLILRVEFSKPRPAR